MVILRENRLCLCRMRHRVKLGINTVLARGRVVNMARRRESSLRGERSDRRTVAVFVVQPLQPREKFRVADVWSVFWLAWLRRMFHALIFPSERAMHVHMHNPYFDAQGQRCPGFWTQKSCPTDDLHLTWEGIQTKLVVTNTLNLASMPPHESHVCMRVDCWSQSARLRFALAYTLP